MKYLSTNFFPKFGKAIPTKQKQKSSSSLYLYFSLYVGRGLNFQFEINQTSKIISQIRICIDKYVIQFSEIKKSDPLI